MLEARQPFRDFVYRAARGNGSLVYYKISGKPIYDAKGGFLGYRGTGTDVTALRTAEAEARENEQRYRKAELELAHANRVATMGQLTSSIAHEVKQPIGAAVGNAQAALGFLARRPPELKEVREALEAIVETGHRAGEIVDRIRELIKKAPPRKECLDINAGIREVIELTRSELVKSGISMQADLADSLPLLKGDRVQLQQVILNLIVNAVEAMSSASDGTRELLVSSRKADPGGVLVGVRDSGPGLAPETLELVFDAFYTTKPDGMACRSAVRWWAAVGDQVRAAGCSLSAAACRTRTPS
jgi:C4-dicarboxylate-specific signal transduction histidine kinase